MKLTSRSDLVKPDLAVAMVAAVSTVVALLAVQTILIATDATQQRMDSFGNATARALAELVVEPLMRQDRLHLSVIGNRLAEAPQISGVASYAYDDQPLASTGELQGPQYRHDVVIDGAIVGHVVVALDPPAFVESSRGRTLALLLTAFAVPLLVGMGWTFVRAAASGALAGMPGGAPARHARSEPAPPPVPAGEGDPAESAPEPQTRHYLLAVNLYNQFTLGVNEREFELSLCAELADAVADVYRGQVVNVPGMGVLLDLDHSDDDDRPFQVLCAAFLLSRLLNDEAPFGHYRLGLNMTARPADEAMAMDDPAVADAALLSALGRGGALAISAPFAQALEGAERFHSQPLVNPLLDELITSSPGCYLVTELAVSYATEVIAQAEQLKTQRDAISSPSTF